MHNDWLAFQGTTIVQRLDNFAHPFQILSITLFSSDMLTLQSLSLLHLETQLLTQMGRYNDIYPPQAPLLLQVYLPMISRAAQRF